MKKMIAMQYTKLGNSDLTVSRTFSGMNVTQAMQFFRKPTQRIRFHSKGRKTRENM